MKLCYKRTHLNSCVEPRSRTQTVVCKQFRGSLFSEVGAGWESAGKQTETLSKADGDHRRKRDLRHRKAQVSQKLKQTQGKYWRNKRLAVILVSPWRTKQTSEDWSVKLGYIHCRSLMSGCRLIGSRRELECHAQRDTNRQREAIKAQKCTFRKHMKHYEGEAQPDHDTDECTLKWREMASRKFEQ